ncbi:hypothetical protein IQ06DRAFT_291453 [Phaeosphaeriaceae sp. SRC1lsM3a]|nr:hypothetical protein IQ06DRAFT_291453 [Stagonospora sp. SRC1lsM3a]
MSTYRALTLGLMALLSSPVLSFTGFEHCSPVPYSTFYATKVSNVNPHLGPKGIYADNISGDCMYLDASASSDFATNHVDEYAAFVGAINGIDGLASQLAFLNEVDDEVSKRDSEGLLGGLEKRTTCKDICSSSLSSRKKCSKCSCKFDYTFCAGGPGGNCVSYYTCK